MDEVTVKEVVSAFLTRDTLTGANVPITLRSSGHSQRNCGEMSSKVWPWDAQWISAAVGVGDLTSLAHLRDNISRILYVGPAGVFNKKKLISKDKITAKKNKLNIYFSTIWT